MSCTRIHLDFVNTPYCYKEAGIITVGSWKGIRHLEESIPVFFFENALKTKQGCHSESGNFHSEKQPRHIKYMPPSKWDGKGTSSTRLQILNTCRVVTIVGPCFPIQGLVKVVWTNKIWAQSWIRSFFPFAKVLKKIFIHIKWRMIK